MLERELTLIRLMEECGEVIQAASKCLRFGFNSVHEDYGKNSDILFRELNDIQTCVDKLNIMRKLTYEHEL